MGGGFRHTEPCILKPSRRPSGLHVRNLCEPGQSLFTTGRKGDASVTLGRVTPTRSRSSAPGAPGARRLRLDEERRDVGCSARTRSSIRWTQASDLGRGHVVLELGAERGDDLAGDRDGCDDAVRLLHGRVGLGDAQDRLLHGRQGGFTDQEPLALAGEEDGDRPRAAGRCRSRRARRVRAGRDTREEDAGEGDHEPDQRGAVFPGAR